MAEKELPAPKNLDALVSQIEAEQGISYARLQREAIRKAATQQLLIVTGGPGTGKTTVMSGILSLFDSMKVKTQLAAPTGRAAKRLSEVTEREASTIHRLLEAQFDEATGLMSFFHDEDEPLKIDAMIVDETSMVDLQLMLSLLRALTPNCRLILVGDPDQLPSVGAGLTVGGKACGKSFAIGSSTTVVRTAATILHFFHTIPEKLRPKRKR